MMNRSTTMLSEDQAPAASAKIVRFHRTGPAEVLQIEEVPLPEPGPGEVRLRVKAIGLNRAEVSFREGRYLVQPSLPSRLGYEAAGIVGAVGPDGDVSLLGQARSTVPAFAADQYGVYGEVAIVPASCLAEYPASLSPELATSIWMQYLTAWGALCHLGQMTAGDYVLITAASSSVGVAAIEMARAEGAFPIAVTRTEAKKQALLDAGAHDVIVTDTEDLAERAIQVTGGKGARLIFDPIGGPILKQLAAAAAVHGIIFEYGGLSSEPTPFPLFAALTKSLTVRGYTLFEFTISDAQVRRQGERYIYDHLVSGALRPRIARMFPFAEIVEAHRYMESNQQIGKIVVTV